MLNVVLEFGGGGDFCVSLCAEIRVDDRLDPGTDARVEIGLQPVCGFHYMGICIVYYTVFYVGHPSSSTS